MRTCKLAACISMVLAGSFCSGRAEVPDFKITPQQVRYKDFEFQIFFREKTLMHNQWRSFVVTIVVSPGLRKVIDETGYLEIWHKGEFVAGSSLRRTATDMLPRDMKKLIVSHDQIVFSFSINTEFINGSWFNYQVRNDDGSVEMNCHIDFTAFRKDTQQSP